MADVIFLMCSERSGSNLISRIFNAHGAYCAPPPAHLFRILGLNLWRYGALDEPENWRLFLEDARDLFLAKLGRWKTDEGDFDAVADRTQTGDAAAFLLALYRAEAALNGKSGLFIKENQIYGFAPLLLAAAPEAKFHFMFRDPRDMALSWLKSKSLRGGPVRAARIWQKDQSSNLALFAQLRTRHDASKCSYENLLSAPEERLRGICETLGIEFDGAMLSFHENTQGVDHPSAAADWSNVSKPFLANNSNKFEDGLNADQIAMIEHRCGALMDVLGYRRHGVAKPADALLEARLEKDEPFDKPAYQTISQEERDQRTQWRAVVDRISSRIPASSRR